MSWQNINPTPRVRFAPSPTGYLHVGGARTALYNYMFAKKNGGEFILRIEDTDTARSTEESLKMVISDLKWLGLAWDEGPHSETLKDMGPYGPYKQSERLSIYKQVADQLLKEGKAYYCFLTDDEIEMQREQVNAEGGQTHVTSPYADWTLEQAQAKLKEGAQATVRFKTKDLKKDYILKDHVRGDVRFPSDMVGDFVLLRSEGMPVYNFCCVVDDHMMKMTHILRAEEHLPNSLRQMMIYEAMGWQLPEFAHISLVLDEDRQKLSKRKGAVACNQFHEEGYLPSAVLNFIALLGWSHPDGEEIMTLEKMISGFLLERLNPSGAVFDRVKLKWMNAMHLRAMPESLLWKEIEPFLKKAGIHYPANSAWQELAVKTFKPAMELLSDSVSLFKLLDDAQFSVLPESAETLAWEPSRAVITAWRDAIKDFPSETFTEDDFLKVQDLVKDKTATKGKNLFMPIRVAVIGKPHGTELKILVPLMNKKSLVQRADIALKGCP